MAKRKKRKKRIFLPKVQTGFCILSFVFVLACGIYYGSRLIKYYKIYNPKAETGEVLLNLPSKIIEETEIVEKGDGLYNINGNYVFKGKNVNNYILVDQMLFRILKINGDKTMDLVMDEYVNRLEWNKELTSFDKSSIKKYLEEKILPIINEDRLTKTTICENTVDDLKEIKCDKTNKDSYIRLLGIDEYLNSLSEEKTFINSGNEYTWLYNTGKGNAWHTTGTYLSNSKTTNVYGVRPVITLRNSVTYLKGDGSIDNPYSLEKAEDIKVGSYIDLNDDVYTVYEVGEDYLKVESNKVLKTKQVFDNSTNEFDKSSLKTYLEKNYVDKLKYKDLLKEVSFGESKSKVGILSSNDLKFNSSLNAYFLSDKEGSGVLLYNGSVLTTEVSSKRNVRPCLGIKKDLKIISGNGSKYAPFIVEV